MKKRKLISILGLVLGFMFVVSSCSSSDSGQSGNPDFTVQPADEVVLTNGTGNYDRETLYLSAALPESLPANSVNRKDTLIIGIISPNAVFNPLLEESQYDSDVNDAMWASLLDINYDGTIIEGLAYMPEISEDGKTYTFTLKDDLKWQDGTPITSQDFDFTFKYIMDKTYTGRFERETLNVLGWEAYRDGTSTEIEGVKIIDDKTFSVTMVAPNAKTLAYFSRDFKPLAKHVYGADYVQGNAKDLDKFNRNPFGNGAYKFVNYKDGEEVVLVANEHYYKGTPKIKNLVFRVVNETNQMLLLENGDVDIMAGSVAVTSENLLLLQQLGFLNANIVEYLGYGYVAINHNEPIMQDLNVRKALAYGLDRNSVVDAAFGGQANVIDVPQSTVSWAYPENGDYTHYEYNPEKAKQLLEEAGWKVGSDGIREKDGVKLSLKFLASSPNTVNDVLVPVMIDNYKAIGIELKAEQMEFRTLVDKQNEAKEGKFSYHLAFLAWSLDIDPDPTSVFASTGVNNKVSYSNPTVDKLLNDALNEMDQTKRKELYEQLYKEISEDLPCLFLYQRKDMSVYSSRVKGMEGETPYRTFRNELEKISFE